jgi:sugar phosphate isomerase/epimerase
MKRRQFIQTSAVAAAAFALPSFAFGESKRKIGLQLYSLRDVIFKDVKGTLEKVASFGYTELEHFGYKDGKLFGLPIGEIGKMTADLGMRITSGHYQTSHFEQWEQAVADAKSIGIENMVISSLRKEEHDTLSNLKKVCESINKKAEISKASGIKMGYHNHDSEFKELEGKVAYDVMLAELDPKLVAMELDLFWAVYANQDPLKMFAAHPGRFEQWHVKDMDKLDRKRNADVGTGSIDFKIIFSQEKLAGLKHFYVEQETYPVSSIDSVKACAGNLKNLL